jgi:hypothetical protein
LKISNHFRIWKLELDYSDSTNGTSITDSTQHSDFSALCEKATIDDETFARFRSCESIIHVLDHVSLEDGQEYFKFIKTSQNNLLEKDVRNFVLKTDKIGRPVRYWISGFGYLSATFLRYLKVAADLERLFGDVSKYEICEIGIGFGGQTAITSRVLGVTQFSLCDLPAVTSLASRYLQVAAPQALVTCVDGRDPGRVKSDLTISNYAFSELGRSTQDKYLENVCLLAPKGYITWNHSSWKYLDGYSLAELIRKIPGSQIMPEIPLTNPHNSIIVWGHNEF